VGLHADMIRSLFAEKQKRIPLPLGEKGGPFIEEVFLLHIGTRKPAQQDLRSPAEDLQCYKRGRPGGEWT